MASALYVYTEKGRENLDWVRNNPHGTHITPVDIDTLLENESKFLEKCQHMVICAPLTSIKKIMFLAMEYHFSLGIIPLPGQKSLDRCYGIPQNPEDILSLALRSG